MSQLRQIAYDCAVYFVEHSHEIVNQLPMTVVKAAIHLTNAGVVQFTQHAIEGLEYLTRSLPSSVVVEREGSDGFLTYIDRESLANWVASAGSATVLGATFTSQSSPAPSLHTSLESGFTGKTSVESISPVKALLREIDPENFVSLESLSKELDALLLEPSALTRETTANALAATPNGEFILICNAKKCSRKNSCATKLHFERVVTPSTDPSLGDCSYLDTCYKGRSCKFVHYNVLPPVKPTVYRTPRFGCTLPCQAPIQHIQCDLRELDFAKLGTDYAAIIVDPPWDIHLNYHSSSNEVSISDTEVLGLDVGRLHSAGVIFLWVTGRVLDMGRKCLKQWGYDHIEEIVWIKTNQLGRTICTGRTGHWLNHSQEHCLVGRKGNPGWINRHVDVDVIVATTQGRSQKPRELYGIIDRMVGPNSKKIELFGRANNLRPGWLTVGKEVPGTVLRDPELSKTKF